MLTLLTVGVTGSIDFKTFSFFLSGVVAMYHSFPSQISSYVPPMPLYGSQLSYGNAVIQPSNQISGLENLAVRQHREISQLSMSQGLNDDMRERLEIMTARCYQLEESSRMHDRDRALLMGLRTKNESLQTTCNTLTGRCSQMERIIQKQDEELESFKKIKIDNISLLQSNEVLRGQLEHAEALVARQGMELAAASSLRADNAALRGTVESMESRIHALEKALRDQTRSAVGLPHTAPKAQEDSSRLLMV